MFNCTVIWFTSVTNHLFTVNIYRNVIFWIICLCQLIYNIKHVFKISAVSTHDCFTSCTPLCQWMRQWRIVAVLWQACSRRYHSVTSYCADVKSNDVIDTQKRQLSSNKSNRQTPLVVYHSETKLSFVVSNLPANIVVRFSIQVSQGIVATYLRRGGRFYSVFCSLSQSATVKELLQESPAVADKPARRLRKVCKVYIWTVAL